MGVVLFLACASFRGKSHMTGPPGYAAPHALAARGDAKKKKKQMMMRKAPTERRRSGSMAQMMLRAPMDRRRLSRLDNCVSCVLCLVGWVSRSPMR